MDSPGTVDPLVCRDVSLLDINGPTGPYEERVRAWERLGAQLDQLPLKSLGDDLALTEVLITAFLSREYAPGLDITASKYSA